MNDLLTEIWESIRRNKLRTALTGFAVAWGIFMLIVLLGAGNGLMNAFMNQGSRFATNTMAVYGGVTSKPANGYQTGRRINLNDQDVAITQSALFADNVDKISPELFKGSYTLAFKSRHTSVYLNGCYPSLMEMNKIEMLEGRFINQNDIKQHRKSIVLAATHATELMNGGEDYASLIGKTVTTDNITWVVVGVYKTDRSAQRVEAFAPITTMQIITNDINNVDQINFSFHGLTTKEENDQFEKTYRAALNRAHKAAPDDESSIWIWNRFTQNMQMNKGTHFIRTALWILGIFTLVGGIVGVSNIMLITVKERTREFGIRKAIGASPWEIMKLILAESVSITALFGYIGMFLGMVACEVMKMTVGQSSVEFFGEKIQLFVNPTVGLGISVGVTILLVVAGTLAGISPAMKAARIRPIEALNDVN
ncbi:MAG: ABC transporter permease [Bacteroidales bacterium]|nr:ABC transporter permease [Bacteroidales bacterium]